MVTPLDDDYLQQGCVIGGASSFHAEILIFRGFNVVWSVKRRVDLVLGGCVSHIDGKIFVLNLQKGTDFTPLQVGLKFQM